MKLERVIGKAVRDKKFHLLQCDAGIWQRVCTWRPVDSYTQIIKGNEITCENCLIRQYDKIW